MNITVVESPSMITRVGQVITGILPDEEFVKPLKESLEKVNVQIEAIEKTRREDYGSLSQSLVGLRTETTSLNTETRNLTNALRTPIVRGRWGEVQLRKVVELAGMVQYCDFKEQPSVQGEEGRLRPDMVVNLPGGKNVVVDSKVPLEAYLKAQESTDIETARGHMRDHARQIRTHIAKLRAKSYAEQFESTPEFVVMFLPGESFFSAALEHEPGNREMRARDQRVAVDAQLVRRDGRLAMCAKTRQKFFVRRRTEDVDAQVVPHDASEKPGIGTAAVRLLVAGAVR